MPDDGISLATLGRGAAIERFDDEFQKILENIMDPNMDSSIREITLKVKIKPASDSRDRCEVAISCSSKRGGTKPFSTTMYVGRGANGAVATEFDQRQMQIDLDASSKPATITLLNTGAK
jgi:hypothetical protein